jgi:hypothetical protein
VLGSPPLATRAEAVLPAGVRAVAVATPENLLESANLPPAFTPLSAEGTVLRQAAERGPRLEDNLAVTSLRDPAEPQRAPCVIKARHLVGLATEGGSVVSELRPRSGFIGKAFLACASTEYLLHNWPILASVLVDAEDPGRMPASLPAMKPRANQPGVFEEPGQEGPQAARRIPGAWLVVSKGEGPQQRALLLAHLGAKIRPLGL